MIRSISSYIPGKRRHFGWSLRIIIVLSFIGCRIPGYSLISGIFTDAFTEFHDFSEHNRPVRMAYFQADVTPPLGSPLAFGVAREIVDSLTARGIILDFDGYPVVLCAVDWLGISEKGMDEFRGKLARAAGTKKERVSVHALHLHDAVRCDFSTPRLLDRFSDSDKYYDTVFLRTAIENVASAVEQAKKDMQQVNHVSYGESKVAGVASNRRLIGSNGKVSEMRWSHTRDRKIRNAPVGTIDPLLRQVTLWNGDIPLVTMTYYAVHPVTTFGDGIVSTDFVGIARKIQEVKRDHPQIYFTGAAGNIGVGKYNDGSYAARRLLAFKLSRAMDEAWARHAKTLIRTEDMSWEYENVFLPIASFMVKDSLEMIIRGEKQDPELPFLRAISSLAWLNRVYLEPEVQISSLKLGKIRLLMLPGEPFVEYQLAAQRMLSGQPVCTAAYTEYGLGYIGTAKAYEEGGYETSKMSSKVSPEVEKVLLKAIRDVLE